MRGLSPTLDPRQQRKRASSCARCTRAPAASLRRCWAQKQTRLTATICTWTWLSGAAAHFASNGPTWTISEVGSDCFGITTPGSAALTYYYSLGPLLLVVAAWLSQGARTTGNTWSDRRSRDRLAPSHPVSCSLPLLRWLGKVIEPLTEVTDTKVGDVKNLALELALLDLMHVIEVRSSAGLDAIKSKTIHLRGNCHALRIIQPYSEN
jgi:hypothetical protein